MWSSHSCWTVSSTARSKDEDDGSGVEVQTDKFGEGSVGLFATRTFEAGSTVVLESPLIWYGDAEEGEKVCAWCLDMIEEPGDAIYSSQMAAPRACNCGCEVGWCSYICQRQDEEMHARICGLLAAGRSVGLDLDAINLLQLVVRIMEVKRWGTTAAHLALGRQRTAGVVLTEEDSGRCTDVATLLRTFAAGLVQHPQDRSVQQTKRRRISTLGHLKSACITLTDVDVQDILKADKANSFMFSLPREPGRAATGARGFGVFPRMALANHSCRPTCVRWDTEGSCATEVTSTIVAGNSDGGGGGSGGGSSSNNGSRRSKSSSKSSRGGGRGGGGGAAYQDDDDDSDGSDGSGDDDDAENDSDGSNDGSSSDDEGRPARGKQPLTVQRSDGRLIPVVSERGRYDVTSHLALRFRAVVDIAPGMEITQSYVELGWPSSLAGSMVLPEMDPLDNEPIILDGDGDDDDSISDSGDSIDDADDDDDDDDDTDDDGGGGGGGGHGGNSELEALFRDDAAADDDDEEDEEDDDDDTDDGSGGGVDLIADLTENGADDADDDGGSDDDSDDDSEADSDAEATSAAIAAAIDAANAAEAVAAGNIETVDLDEDEVNEMLDVEEMGQEDLAALTADFVSRGTYLLQEYGFNCKCDRCVIEAAYAPDDAAWQKHYEWMTRHLCSQESCSGTRTPCNHPDCRGEDAHLECHLCGDTVTESEVQAIVHALDYHDVDEPADHGGDDDAEEVD